MAERRKLVMLGMAGVGKTSIVNRIVDDTFDDNERTTIGGTLPEAMFTLSRTRERTPSPFPYSCLPLSRGHYKRSSIPPPPHGPAHIAPQLQVYAVRTRALWWSVPSLSIYVRTST